MRGIVRNRSPHETAGCRAFQRPPLAGVPGAIARRRGSARPPLAQTRETDGWRNKRLLSGFDPGFDVSTLRRKEKAKGPEGPVVGARPAQRLVGCAQSFTLSPPALRPSTLTHLPTGPPARPRPESHLQLPPSLPFSSLPFPSLRAAPCALPFIPPSRPDLISSFVWYIHSLLARPGCPLLFLPLTAPSPVSDEGWLSTIAEQLGFIDVLSTRSTLAQSAGFLFFYFG